MAAVTVERGATLREHPCGTGLPSAPLLVQGSLQPLFFITCPWPLPPSLVSLRARGLSFHRADIKPSAVSREHDPRWHLAPAFQGGCGEQVAAIHHLGPAVEWTLSPTTIPGQPWAWAFGLWGLYLFRGSRVALQLARHTALGPGMEGLALHPLPVPRNISRQRR